MKLFYTGAVKFNDPQLDALKSLGGYISDSEIPNASLNNLFGDISKFGIWNRQQTEYRAIALYNDSGIAATNLKAIFQYPTDDESDSDADNSELIASFEIGSESAMTDECGDISSTHQIKVPTSQPYGVTFYMADGLENALNMPDLANGQYIIIWLKRTIKSSAKNTLSDDDYLAILNNTLTLPTLEEVALRIIWDGV